MTEETRFISQREQLLQTPIMGVIADIDGTIRFKGKTHPDIIARFSELAQDGVVISVSTARGESVLDAFVKPMTDYLDHLAIDTKNLSFIVTTRNGGCTEDMITGEILDDHPIPDELFERIVTHPLIAAFEKVTVQKGAQECEKFYEKIVAAGGKRPDEALIQQHPAILHDIHRKTGNRYKVTLFYLMEEIAAAQESGDEELKKAVATIAQYAGGEVPRDQITMAQIVKKALNNAGIEINTAASASDPEVEIIMKGVSKALGTRVVRKRVVEQWGKSGINYENVAEHILLIGDSPDGNDRELLAHGGIGITNIPFDRSAHHHLIGIHDMPYPKDQVDQTALFLELLNRLVMPVKPHGKT